MATLSKRTDNGAFFVQFFDSERAPKRKRVYLKDEDGDPITRRRDADPLYRALVRKYEMGDWCPWDGDLTGPEDLENPEYPTSLKDALDAFLHYKSLSIRPISVRGYKNTLEPIVRELGENRRVHTVNPVEVMEVVAGREVRATTASGYINQFGVFLRWCHAEGVTRVDLTERLKAPKKPETSLLDRYIPPPSIIALVETVRAQAPDYHQWIVPVIHVGVNTGLRNTELRTTTWRDLRLDSKTPQIIVPAERSKNAKVRTIPLNGPALSAAQSLVEDARARGTYEPNGIVFQDDNGPLSRDHVTKTFKRYVELTKAVPDRIHFHCLRHTFCSLLAQRGVSAVTIRDLAGHRSIQTSERYIHAFAEHSAAEATRALNEVWG